MLKANVVDTGGESKDEEEVEYDQDSNNADSPIDDSGVGDDDTASKKRKRKKRDKYPRYPGPSIVIADLHVDMKLRDKKQLKEAVDSYRIVKGYNLKITKSDIVRFQRQCRKWSM